MLGHSRKNAGGPAAALACPGEWRVQAHSRRCRRHPASKRRGGINRSATYDVESPGASHNKKNARPASPQATHAAFAPRGCAGTAGRSIGALQRSSNNTGWLGRLLQPPFVPYAARSPPASCPVVRRQHPPPPAPDAACAKTAKPKLPTTCAKPHHQSVASGNQIRSDQD